jgi:hypothetical protein
MDAYFRIGKPEKAIAVGNQLASETLDLMIYYSQPVGAQEDDLLDKQLSDDAATLYYYLIRAYDNYGYKEQAKTLEMWLHER